MRYTYLNRVEMLLEFNFLKKVFIIIFCFFLSLIAHFKPLLQDRSGTLACRLLSDRGHPGHRGSGLQANNR